MCVLGYQSQYGKGIAVINGVEGGHMKKPGIILAIFVGIHLFSIISWGACKDLVDELYAMKKAQSQIIAGLANNHEAFAESMEDISMELELRNKVVPKKVIQNMNKSAQLFRKRGQLGEQQLEKLEAATTDLIQQVAVCLKR